MILVDSSVWVDFFSARPGRGGDTLRSMIEDAEPFALTGIVVAEVLQGLTRDVGRIESYLAQWELLEPAGFSTYRDAAAIFRKARAQGITLTTTDALIAAIALEHDAALFTLDKDFARIVKWTGLVLVN